MNKVYSLQLSLTLRALIGFFSHHHVWILPLTLPQLLASWYGLQTNLLKYLLPICKSQLDRSLLLLELVLCRRIICHLRFYRLITRTEYEKCLVILNTHGKIQMYIIYLIHIYYSSSPSMNFIFDR